MVENSANTNAELMYEAQKQMRNPSRSSRLYTTQEDKLKKSKKKILNHEQQLECMFISTLVDHDNTIRLYSHQGHSNGIFTPCSCLGFTTDYLVFAGGLRLPETSLPEEEDDGDLDLEPDADDEPV